MKDSVAKTARPMPCHQHLPRGERIDGDRHSQKLENRMQGHDKLIRLMGVAIAIDPLQVVYMCLLMNARVIVTS